MGCDIHFFTERFTSSNDYDGPKDLKEERSKKLDNLLGDSGVQERWVSADKWEKSDQFNRIKEWNLLYEYYDSRNYYIFSILAGVRSGSYDTDPIDYPRGVPEDASFGYLYKVNQWSGDAHSHSYFTLEELINIDWSKYEIDDQSILNFLKTIEEMKLIDEDPSKIRCCFFFDN